MRTNKKIMLSGIIIALCLLPLTTAVDWTQYTPAPTSNDIIRIFSLSTGYAVAYTTGGNNILIYNQSAWQEITKPNSSTLGDTQTFLGGDKLSNGNVILTYTNTSVGNKIRVFELNPATQIYTLKITSTKTSDITGFECDETTNKCYIRYGLYNNSQIYPSDTDINNIITSGYITLNSNKKYWLYSSAGVQYWNGVSWNVYTAVSSAKYKIIETDNYKAVMGASVTSLIINFYNVSTNTFHPITVTTITNPHLGATQYDSSNFFISNDTHILKCDWVSESCIADTSIANPINSMDYDETTNIGWAGGISGTIYQLGTLIPTSNYTLNTRISPNPTTYNNAVNWYATATHPLGESSNIVCGIYLNTTYPYYGSWTINGVTNGMEVSNGLIYDDVAWTNFPTEGNFTLYCNATSTTSLDTTIATNLTWQIIGSSIINQTIYNLTRYQANTTGYDEIKAVTTITKDNGFATGINTTLNSHILSFDSSIPSTIYIHQKYLTADRNPMTSISQSGTRLYVGTNNDLFVFNTSESGDAQNLVFENSYDYGLLVSHYVWDTTPVSDTLAWTCQKGYLTDSGQLFNLTSGNFPLSISENPCKSIYYDSNTDLLIIHKGTNGIKIYNQTTQTLISSITGINTQGIDATQDRIDIEGNYLYILTASNTISKYNISNPATPTKIAECRTDRDIISIEAINENEIIIGAGNSGGGTRILICDFNNTETYYISGAYYIATNLYSYTNNELPLEIEKMDDNKIQVAENNAYSIYYYTKTTQETPTNNPPTINNIASSVSSGCLEQIIYFTIEATDLDDDELNYDFDCYGTQSNQINHYLNNQFACSYTTTGTKTIKAFAYDGIVSVSTTRSFTINNCTTPNQIQIKTFDYETGIVLSNVIVTNMNTSEVKTTDSTGNVNFIVFTNNTYHFTLTKTGYLDGSVSLAPSNLISNIYLYPIAPNGTSTTLLIIYTLDSSGNPISGSIVGATDPISGESRSAITNTYGKAILYNMFIGNKILVGGENKEKDYAYTTTYTDLLMGEQKTITLTLTKKLAEGEFPITNRGCADTIAGVILCGNLSITGVGSNCTQDTDCISGRCSLAVTPEARRCSTFNYTLCDTQGINRGNTCVFRNITYGILRGIGNFILDYFLYVLIIILLLVAGLIIKKNLSR